MENLGYGSIASEPVYQYFCPNCTAGIGQITLITKNGSILRVDVFGRFLIFRCNNIFCNRKIFVAEDKGGCYRDLLLLYT